jgi:hypothetical protein
MVLETLDRPKEKDISVPEERWEWWQIRYHLPLRLTPLSLTMKRSDGYRCFLLAGGIVFAVGCGLSEYQSKYEKQQERMNYLDQENLYLGQPRVLSTMKESSAPRVSIRFPLGISVKPDEETVGILYHYAKSSAKSPQNANVKVSDIESVFVAVETSKDWKEFKKRALEPFKGVDPESSRTVSLGIPGRPPRSFETMAFTDGADPSWAYRFYFFRDDNSRVALGFRGSESALASETARQAMEFSVKTLAVDKTPGPSTKKSSGG